MERWATTICFINGSLLELGYKWFLVAWEFALELEEEIDLIGVFFLLVDRWLFAIEIPEGERTTVDKTRGIGNTHSPHVQLLTIMQTTTATDDSYPTLVCGSVGGRSSR